MQQLQEQITQNTVESKKADVLRALERTHDRVLQDLRAYVGIFQGKSVPVRMPVNRLVAVSDIFPPDTPSMGSRIEFVSENLVLQIIVLYRLLKEYAGLDEDSPLVKQYATEFYQLADVLSAEGYIMHVSGHQPFSDEFWQFFLKHGRFDAIK